MAKGGGARKTTDVVQEVNQKHAEEMAAREQQHRAEKTELVQESRNLFCIRSWGELGMMLGSLGAGVTVGNVVVRLTDTRWRILPVVGGLGLVYYGWQQRKRGSGFTKHAALSLAGTGMLLPVIRVNLEDQFLTA